MRENGSEREGTGNCLQGMPAYRVIKPFQNSSLGTACHQFENGKFELDSATNSDYFVMQVCFTSRGSS